MYTLRLHVSPGPLCGLAMMRFTPLAAAVLALTLAACGGGEKPAAAGGGAPPPPPVGVLTVQPQAVALQTELPGRVEALRTAQVRARVNGVVQQRLFTEGSEVKAGQPLFRIDAAPYQAAVDSAQAGLLRAEAAAAQAKLTADRYAPLADAKAISQQDYAAALATQKTAEADVAAGKAALQTARISLGYASVTAPISGRIGRALVTEGALVSATEATSLALIQQVGSVYVNFTQSAGEVLRLKRALAAGQLQRLGGDAVAVRVLLEDGSELPRAGKLLFSDLSVDATSGQVTLRAEVPNPDGLLLPGQYVRVRLAQATLPAAVLVPQQAVTRSAQGDTVLVVGEGNKPGNRTIKVSGAQNGQWVVTDGLKPGDQVIVDGFQKMFVPGAPVTPVPWNPVAASAPASAASR
ncbi:MAG: efflux RND transporter periplasmic adaptor subunit [Rubrivivax sp.]|nr:efflux RND transporter periplasmic adaptor subunit [Rubrivivax sp.]